MVIKTKEVWPCQGEAVKNKGMAERGRVTERLG